MIYAKLALQRYPALTVTAWAMMAASLTMAVLAGILNNNCEVIRFVCPPVGALVTKGSKSTVFLYM